jgi:hypothetical protein
MPPTDTCHHCGYAIPHDASICPGCNRRHGRPAPRLEDRAHGRSVLVREAIWARRLLVATGWLGLGLGLVAVARPVAAWDRMAEHLRDDAALQLDHLGRLAACSALLCLVLAAATALAWSARSRRHAEALGLAHDPASPWSLPGWLLPGQEARQARIDIDQIWRDTSPLVASLPHRGWSRRLVSRVALRWWSLWTWLPAVVLLGDLVFHADDGALGGARSPAAVAAAALLVATSRAYYDVIGIVTVAHAHRAATARRAPDPIPVQDPEPPAVDPLDPLEPLAGELGRLAG